MGKYFMSEYSKNRGHRSGDDTRSFCAYTIYDNRIDMPIIIDGTAEQCARAMHISLASFYSTLSRARKGEVKRWSIYRRYLDNPYDDDAPYED